MDKFQYKGYLVLRRTNENGDVSKERKSLGYTYATSEKKAISNFRYRTIGKGKNSYTYDMGYDTSVQETFEVELVG